MERILNCRLLSQIHNPIKHQLLVNYKLYPYFLQRFQLSYFMILYILRLYVFGNHTLFLFVHAIEGKDIIFVRIDMPGY